jgi:hypothetical protein
VTLFPIASGNMTPKKDEEMDSYRFVCLEYLSTPTVGN